MEDGNLVKLAKQGNEKALVTLTKKYRPYFKSLALTKFNYILELVSLDELIQEALIVMLVAIDRYDPNREASFKTFTTFCVGRKWRNLYRDAKRKATNYGTVISLDQVYVREDSEYSYYDLIPDQKTIDPNDQLLFIERIDEMLEIVDHCRIKYAKEVISMLMLGYSRKEIGEALDITEKRVGNIIYRIRKLL